jgi:hypothetical protein
LTGTDAVHLARQLGLSVPVFDADDKGATGSWFRTAILGSLSSATGLATGPENLVAATANDVVDG